MSTAATGKAGDATGTVESTAQHDNKVHPVRLGHANVCFIETTSGYILVDAGMPRMEGKLDGAFKKAGVDPNGVRLIIATHGHLDHNGSTACPREVSGGEVMCHRSHAGDLENGCGKGHPPKSPWPSTASAASAERLDGVQARLKTRRYSARR